ncbi:unnamed protein product, partial [Pylaiella littoralis]
LGTVKARLWHRVLSVTSRLLAPETEGESTALSEEGLRLLTVLEAAVRATLSAAEQVMEAASQARIEVEVICAPIYAQMTKKEARSTEVPLHGMEGPWEPPNQDPDQISACDGPARLVVIPAVQERKKEYIQASARVITAEKEFRAETGTTLKVQVAGSSQIEMSSVRYQALGESRPWSFFSHCCNRLGGNIRSVQRCAVCDSHTTILTTCIRALSFMTDLGTNHLESMNGSIAAKATKRSDFPLTHWARAQIGIMNR